MLGESPSVAVVSWEASQMGNVGSECQFQNGGIDFHRNIQNANIDVARGPGERLRPRGLSAHHFVRQFECGWDSETVGRKLSRRARGTTRWPLKQHPRSGQGGPSRPTARTAPPTMVGSENPPLHIGLPPIVLLNGVRGEIARSPRADGSGRAHPWRSCAVCSRAGPSLSAAVWT